MKKNQKVLIVFSVLTLFWLWSGLAFAATSAKVIALRASHDGSRSRLVFDVTGAVKYTVSDQSKPDRIVIDIENAEQSTTFKRANLANTPVQNFHFEPQTNNSLRIVLELKAPAKAHVFTLTPAAQYGHRLVLDLFSLSTKELTAATASTATQSTTTNETSKNNQRHIKDNVLGWLFPEEETSAAKARAPVIESSAHATPTPKPAAQPQVKLVAPAPTTVAANPTGQAPIVEGKPVEVATAPKQTAISSEQISALSTTNVKSEPKKPLTTAAVTPIKPATIEKPKPATVAAPKETAPKPVITSTAADVTAPANNKLGRDIVIVIDPGHGGKDPGATGPAGHDEKMVVLAIAKILQRSINQEPGFRAELTRDSDYYLPLRQRLAIARQRKADLFIAIHADAYKNSYVNGASVFALSERGATSEAARWLAEKENESELVDGVVADKDNALRSVLLDLSQTHTIDVSLQVGNNVLRQLSAITQLHYTRVEQAAFVVLKSPDIPSLLIETGYLSNPQQERQLVNPQYQQQLARSITQGVKSYFVHNPPRGTLLANNRGNFVRYVVVRGDTLPKIAQRYSVDAAKIRDQNNLASDALKAGQVLLIPSGKRSYASNNYSTLENIQ